MDFSGANPVIYATTGAAAGNSLIAGIDTGAATTTFSLLESAPASTAFRGLTFAPISAAPPVVLSIARSGTNAIISWTGSGTLQSATAVTGAWANVTGAPTSPYTNAISGNARLYRVGGP